MGKKKFSGGLYLVLDPKMNREILLEKLKLAVEGGVEIVQIWNSWPGNFTGEEKVRLIGDVIETVGAEVAVIINEEWELLKMTRLDGVHFDKIPACYQDIQKEAGRPFIAGVTCGSDLSVVRLADSLGFDYISFCAMFPSESVDSCEIVNPETVREAGKMTQLPLFVSGGITVENLRDLGDLDIDGAAVISGIINARDPAKSAREYKQVLENMRKLL